MAKLTGGEVLVRTLLKEKVKKVFGIPGDQLYPFLDAIKRTEGIDFIMTRHEQAAAHAADAWARVTGEPGVCLGTVGPGAADLVPGVYVAYADSIPMLVLAAQNQSWRINPDHGSMQALDQYSLFAPITKWRATITHWKRIPSIIQWAYRMATSGRPGPVFVDIAVDVLYQKGDINDLEMPIVEPQHYRSLVPPIGDLELIKKAAKMLVEADFPLIHVGGGVLASNASKEVIELAEHLGIPVTTTLFARGVIPEDHDLCLLPGGYGAIAAQAEADVVLAVGTRFGDLDFWGKPPAWGEFGEQKVIQIDIDPAMIGLNRPIDLGIVGDAKLTLRALFQEVKKLRPEKQKIREKLIECKEAEEVWLSQFSEGATSDNKPIHPLRLIKEVYEFFPKDAIRVVDGGNTVMWAVYQNRVHYPRTYLWPSDSGHLGTGLPFAIGAKLALPERPVYLLTGDGAFMFNIQELETAARLKLPIVIIVANDKAYGMIKAGQKALYEERYIGVDFIDSRYDKIAEAMGCYGERIDDPNEIKHALQRAVDSKKPAVIDVLIDGSINLEPPDFETVASIWLEGVHLPTEEE